jgi:hypothetical protein
MAGGLNPTETTDRHITVIVLRDSGTHDRIDCTSFEEAIDIVKDRSESATVTKIETRDEEIVFSSEEMDIDDWENEWRHAKRRLSVDVEDHTCPYDNIGCLSDDLCVQCKMDAVRQNSQG